MKAPGRKLNLVADMARVAASRGADEAARDVVDAVAAAFAPEARCDHLDRHALAQIEIDARMNIDDVAPTDRRQLAKIFALGKKGVEGAEAIVRGIAVAAGDIGTKAKARFERRPREVPCGFGAERPGADAVAVELPALEHGLPVPAEVAALAEKAQPKRVARLEAGASGKASSFIFIV
jgi:hypothetical protein